MRPPNANQVAVWLAGLLLALFCGWGHAQPEATHRQLTLATLNWEPYYGASLPQNGYFAEMVTTAFEQVGYSVDIVFVPWKRALQGAKGGLYDGLLGAYYTDERDYYFEFSRPVHYAEEVFFRRVGSGVSYEKLRDLVPYRIGVLRGGSHTEKLDNAHFLTKEKASSVALNIKKLVKGNVDLIATGKLNGLYVIHHEFPQWGDVIEPMSPPLKRNPLYVAISYKTPNAENVIRDFNQGIEAIMADGTYWDILEKHGFGRLLRCDQAVEGIIPPGCEQSDSH